MSKLKKILFILSITILIFIVVIIAFISPITKYMVEKYDEKYTGRQITMDWAYVNPFTGYLHFKNLKIYELKSDSVFFSADGISVNFAVRKMLSKTYEITGLTIDHPRGTIIQDKKEMNINDLIEKFSPKNKPSKNSAPAHVDILNIKINDGEFYYHEKQTPINYSIRKVNFESSGMRWNTDTVAMKFFFVPGEGGGGVNGDFTINLKNNDYRVSTNINRFDLQIIGQYLKELTNYGNFSANLDAHIKATGNLKDEENIIASGSVAVNDFHLGKNLKDDYLAFNKLSLVINELAPKGHKYLLDSITLLHPYFKYERYDHLDNLQRMFGTKGSNIAAVNADPTKFNLVIEIAKYIKTLSRNFFRSSYKINHFAIDKADLKFNDYSLSNEFSASFNPLYIIADSIGKTRKRANVSLRSGIDPYGKVAIDLSIDPNDSTDFDMNYHLQKLPAAMFNPYIVTFTSFPLDRGSIELNGSWNVRKGIIKSDNHLMIIDPRATKRIRNKDTKWIPLPLIFSFIRERGNVIDYEIPITGSLKNPKFHLHDVIIHLLENIFVKPATTGYRMQVKNIETEIEKSLTVKWALRNSTLLPDQEKFIGSTSDFLAKNPEAFIDVYPQQYATKEKEYVLFFEAKKKYFMAAHHLNAGSFSAEDSGTVDKLSVKDSLFIHYLNKEVKNQMLFTVQEKCAKLIDPNIVDNKLRQLNMERENNFMSFFKNQGIEKQVKMHAIKNVVPFNGFSFYEISYKGEFPESLLKAYRKLSELNKEDPRKKFEKERKENKSKL
jgi:hypothetical protein